MYTPNQGQLTAVKMEDLQTTVTKLTWVMYMTRHFANTSLPSCQIRRQSVYSNIRHPYEGQLTAVKLGIR